MRQMLALVDELEVYMRECSCEETENSYSSFVLKTGAQYNVELKAPCARFCTDFFADLDNSEQFVGIPSSSHEVNTQATRLKGNMVPRGYSSRK
jgi:hypothetical protein